MEDEKKKKKNKKKKNKQTKTTADVTHGVWESTNTDQNRVIEVNHDNQVSGAAEFHGDEPKTDVELDRHSANGTEDSALGEDQKVYWMDREASFEEIKKLEKENDAHIQKEASLEETIIKLQKENDTHIQEKANLEETIKRLQKENSTHMQKEGSFEMMLLQLHSEKDSWLQKEAAFEEKINRLIDETASLSLKGVSLEEKIKQMEREKETWVQKEISMKETIASLNGDNTRLQIQVMELEESRNSLLQENLQLTESMSVMQSRVQNIEKSIDSAYTSTTTVHASGSKDVNAQMEAASQLVEKLVAENEELVEKVNELCVELDLQGVTAELAPAVGSVAESGEMIAAPGERIDSPKHVPIKDEKNGGDDVNSKDTGHVAYSMSESSESTSLLGKRTDQSPEDVSRQNGEYTSVIPNSPDTVDSEEIVQIPLDEKEVGDPGGLPTHDEQKTDVVPLIEAPLIGAPFRLISFVARYVSGADLVNKT